MSSKSVCEFVGQTPPNTLPPSVASAHEAFCFSGLDSALEIQGLGNWPPLDSFSKKRDALPACVWNSLHVSELCAAWCCCSCFSVIVLCHFMLGWLCFVACQFALGISARGCFPEFDVSCFSFCPFLECRQRPSNLTLMKDIAMWPNG